MIEYFKNKYRINLLRLRNWDYSWSGLYFVTICTKDKICFMSEIKNDKIYLTEIGKIVFEEWLNNSELRKNVFLDDFIIMPNHIHGIIGIEDNDFDKRRDTPRHVSTNREFGYLPAKSLSSIINHFTGAVKRKCIKRNLDFYWQSNYYEHIIRDQDDLSRIKEYISNNPINWENDRNNPNN